MQKIKINLEGGFFFTLKLDFEASQLLEKPFLKRHFVIFKAIIIRYFTLHNISFIKAG